MCKEGEAMRTISTEESPVAIGPYSQAKVFNRLVFLSGQCPFEPRTGDVVGSDIESQARQTIMNVGAVLKASGANFASVIKTTCYLADMNDFAKFNAVYEQYFVDKPARSCIAVRELPKGVLCEIEVIAEVVQE